MTHACWVYPSWRGGATEFSGVPAYTPNISSGSLNGLKRTTKNTLTTIQKVGRTTKNSMSTSNHKHFQVYYGYETP
ncbi:MAG: hypothetical protein KGI88_07710, partial [Betaproteobacteria bacterium]|nr:hypothetical protein [Betaproteobacteria bacterium]